MNIVNLCLKIPNLGILVYYLVFIVIIPYLLIFNKNLNLLKYYMPLMVVFAHLLSRVGKKEIFNNLYDLNPKNFIPFISSNFINLFALFGVIWQAIEHSRKFNVTSSGIYGVLLFIITFPLARTGLKFVLDNTDKYLKEKTDMEFKHEWHLIVFGVLYIIFILGIQAVLITILEGKSYSIEDNLKNNNKNNKNNNNNVYENSNNVTDEKELDELLVNLQNKLNNTNNNTQKANNANNAANNNTQKANNNTTKANNNAKANNNTTKANNNATKANNNTQKANNNKATKTKRFLDKFTISNIRNLRNK